MQGGILLLVWDQMVDMRIRGNTLGFCLIKHFTLPTQSLSASNIGRSSMVYQIR